MAAVIRGCALPAVVLLAATTVVAQESPLWEQARKAHETAMSPYRSGNYQQALGLLEEFIKDFPTNEWIPVAELQLAKCRQNLNNLDGYDSAIKDVIAKFPGSPTWFVAMSWKLSRLKALKKNDDYLTALEQISRAFKEIPLDLSFADMDYYYWQWYGRNDHWRAIWQVYAFIMGGTVFWSPGMEQDIVDVCDTRVRAERAVAVMGPTFKKHAKELSPEWQFAQCQLLKLAGRGAEAAKNLQTYKDDWGADPRGMYLLVLIGEAAQDANDDKTADQAFGELSRKYGTYGITSEVLDGRLNYLRRKNRLGEWASLARFYLKEFPSGRLREELLRTWMQNSAALIASGDANAEADGQELLDKYLGGNSGYCGLLWHTQVSLGRKNFPEAAATAAKLAGDKFWSAGTYSLLTSWSPVDAALKKVLDDACRKYGILPPDEANSPAVALLAQLQDRAKEDQVRHMEEIGEELCGKYPSSPATIQAVKFLADYYFAKVEAEPRDRWMQKMIVTYPRHPLTQPVMLNKITALGAAKLYKELLAAIEEMLAAFPGVQYENGNYNFNYSWYDQCLACFDAMHDPDGKEQFVKTNFAAPVAAGDIAAINRLVLSRIRDPNASRVNGGLWMEQGRAVKGTRAEVYCLSQAINEYYMWPARRPELHRELCWKEAMGAVHAIQDQKIDPLMQWSSEFLDVMLTMEKPDVKAGLALLDKKLTAKKYRDLSSRLNFDVMVQRVRESNQAPQAFQLARKIENLCFTTLDDVAVTTFMARVLHANADDADAIRCYMKLINDCPWPAAQWNVFCEAFGCVEPEKCDDICEGFAARMPNAQDMVPRIWAMEAQGLWSKKIVPVSVGQRLAKSYPASEALGQVAGMMVESKQPPK